ncbi:hypothetical protein CF98_00295 [Halopseudomonas bauzanensis]|nr:hypothetical protein CF98_00295 [Halopseudomonas bauzanensis]
MGDALLAFFGGKQLTKEDSIINTINCVVLLQSIMTDTIIPSLVERGYSIHHLGFRIGFDFGDDNQVLWRSFGFNDVREITATSFSVDFSAKLQSYASKNQSMLGERLIKFIDFPEKYTSIKKIIKNGETEDLSSKTYTGKDGESIKYNFRQLNHELYRDLLPYPVKVKSALASSKTIYSPGFELTCINKNSQEIIRSVSKCHEKQVDILFKLNLTAACYKDESIFPLTITFVKCNNGEEARKRNEEKEVTVINKIHPYPAGTHGFFHGETIKVNETTLYRGLHTMTVEVKTKLGLPIFKDFFGIYII